MAHTINTKTAMVINGHGIKTNKYFRLNSGHLITPENLEIPYIFNVDQNVHIENSLRRGELYPVLNGQWHLYEQNNLVPDVIIQPWQPNEAKSFASRLLNDNHLWSHLDGQHNYLNERDQKCVLVVRYKGQNRYLAGSELIDYCHKLKNGHAVEGTPYIFISPHLGKIKVLNTTSLSEVMNAQSSYYGKELTMLATCNAESILSKNVGLETNKAPLYVEDIFAKPKGVFSKWNTMPKPSYISKDDLNEEYRHSHRAAPAA